MIGEPMPVEDMALNGVHDVTSDIEDYLGRLGGDYDADSGVLELRYVKNEDWHEFRNDEGTVDVFDDTTVRFVEVEKLLDVLWNFHMERDQWRTWLLEKLDAKEL